MLRRRILASAMASVMAIGSVAVVANAETTAAATTQVKSRDDLKAYIDSLDSFRSSKIYDYGSVSGENFLNALEYADNVLDNTKSTVDDYTTAYAMVEAVYNKLKIYTAEELKALVNSSKSIYETNNINNEDLGDAIYTADSFSAFEEAYENAESVLNSADSRIITDAYEVLYAAKAALSPLDVVTKAQFRAALKAYETALSKEFAYDAWRVGTLDTGWAYWGYQDQSVAYGTVYEHVASLKTGINDAYGEFDEIKSVNKTTQTNIVDAYKACVAATTVLNGFKADDTNRATKANVKTLLNQYNGRLVYDYKTTDAEKLYEAVVALLGADKVHNRKGDKYSSNIDMKVAGVAAGADAWYVVDSNYTVNPNGWTWSTSVDKKNSAEISIKTDSKFYIELTKDGYATGNVATDKTGFDYYKLINAKSEVDLTDYIKVDAASVDHDTDNHLINNVNDGDAVTGSSYPVIGQWGAIAGAAQTMNGSYTNSSNETVDTYADLGKAMELAELYLTGEKKDIEGNTLIEDIDTIDAISAGSAKGSSTEWTLVYRYLKYALADKYDASYGTKTKADVSALIDKCYELAELTGDAALFSCNHNILVTARQDAINWVKAANKIKTYKDNVTPADCTGTIINGSLIATQVYETLEGEYNKLLNDYNAFKYSFEQIYIEISEVKDSIDNGDLKATDALTAALENTAYYLSVVESIDVDASGTSIELDNDAFTSDRQFQGFNRVYTNGDNEYDLKLDSSTTVKIPKSSKNAASLSHANLTAAYEALLAAVKEQTEVKTVVGDVNGDGVVNALDAAAILKAVAAGTAIDAAAGDYNADGVVNALDASAILKAVTQA
jgi:hypothetical protein